MTIAAKQTYYKGNIFRSRLEAKWAVFFDEMGIKYRYEPGTYRVPMDGYFMRYCPDFVLQNVRTQQEIQQPLYVEVKGVERYSDINQNEQRKIESFANKNSILVLGSFPPNVSYLPKGPDYLCNFFLINGQNIPCFFVICNGEPWLVDQYRLNQIDCKQTNNALWMACNACFEDPKVQVIYDGMDEPPF